MSADTPETDSMFDGLSNLDFPTNPDDLIPFLESINRLGREKFEKLERERDEILESMKEIARISHSGGIDGLSELQALVAVRRISLKWWDNHLIELLP